MSAENRLKELGIELPPPPSPAHTAPVSSTVSAASAIQSLCFLRSMVPSRAIDVDLVRRALENSYVKNRP